MLEGRLWSHIGKVLSCWFTNSPTLPPSALQSEASVVSKRQVGKWGAGEAGIPFSSWTNGTTVNKHTHPQPEPSWSKAYFEFIWCAIRYLLKMKKNDLYCTELLHIVIYLSAFRLKQTTKKRKKKKKKKENEKGAKRNYKTKAAPRHFNVSCWRSLVSPMEVPTLPYILCFWLFSIGMWHWDIRHLSFLITESLIHSKQHILW